MKTIRGIHHLLYSLLHLYISNEAKSRQLAGVHWNLRQVIIGWIKRMERILVGVGY